MSAVITNRLLELGKSLRKRVAGKPAMSEAQVVARLEHELETFLGGQSVDGCINPLLGI